MRELVWVLGLIGLLWGVGAAVQLLATDTSALRIAWLSLVGLGAGSVVAEIVYFTLLGVGLGRAGERPPRWYARSFEHHDRLSPGWKRVALPFFWLGFVGLLGALALAILIGVAAFLGLRAGV
ncbi:MAG: hypothetical protein AAGH15_07755 [Myxococcota bacterium]